MSELEDSFERHEPCPKCGGRDSLARYRSGSASCFAIGCKHWEPSSNKPLTPSPTGKKTVMTKDLILDGVAEAIPTRGLSEETCSKWGYKIGKDKHGTWVHIASYVKDGQIVAQKIRYKDKTFKVLGDAKSMGLYGMHLWRDGGKRVVITEGEIDALSVSQVQNNKWAVVSIPNGCQAAKKSLSANLEWLEQFEEVVLMFDNDEPGNLAVEECVSLFTPGKCKVARLPLKDANAMLLADRGAELISAIWDAKVYRPEAVLSVADAYEEAIKVPTMGIPWCWDSLTKLTYGIQRKTSYYLGAGVGIGKTNWAKELQSWLVNTHNLKVGVFMLEEPVGKTLKGIAGKFVGKAFHRPDLSFTPDELKAAIDSLDDKVFLYNHPHSGTDWDSIKSAIRYMVVSLGVKDIFLDNLTVMVAHLPATEANDEVNRIAQEISKLLQELDFTLYGFSHLNKPDKGEPHEMGGKVLESQFTGSRGLMRFGNYMFGLERSKDPELPKEERNLAHMVLLKDREYGNVGRFPIFYNDETDQFLEPNPFADSTGGKPKDNF
jgi:twinkle protein